MSILTSEMNSLSQFCYSLMCLMQLLFELRPNLAHKYSKIFSFIACARGHLSLWRWIILAHICFKSAFFHKKIARARNFAQIPSKPKNACSIHNSEFACKKSASYDNSKLCLTTVYIFRRVIRFAAPPLIIQKCPVVFNIENLLKIRIQSL